MEKVIATIREYLLDRGSMSRRDICEDCYVNNVDIDLAEQDGSIMCVPPAPGGYGEWYAAS